jgi:hypothetical protein
VEGSWRHGARDLRIAEEASSPLTVGAPSEGQICAWGGGRSRVHARAGVPETLRVARHDVHPEVRSSAAFAIDQLGGANRRHISVAVRRASCR